MADALQPDANVTQVVPSSGVTDILAHLDAGERAQVLAELLKRHPDLHEEAAGIARNVLNDVSVEGVAEEVASLVGGIEREELANRAGTHSWGYVEPGEAAWQLLDESIEAIRADMQRRYAAGDRTAAERVCAGIIAGLHSVDGTDDDGVLGWAPDFPAEAAGWAFTLLLQMYPQRQRQAAGNRIVQASEEQAGGWAEMLNRVVEEAMSARRDGGK